MTDAELRALLNDCITLWGIDGRVTATDAGIQIITSDGNYTLQPAPSDVRPVRWFLQTPPRRAAGPPQRAAPSTVTARAALRNTPGGEAGNRLRIGSGDTAP